MARDSIFRIFSMTKPVTGVAMMMLYEEGKWRMNDPVARYIPELAGLKVHVGDEADGSMRLEDADHEMTMRELMTHTAGLGFVLNPRHPVNQLFSGAPGTEPDAAAVGEDRQAGRHPAAGPAGPALDLQRGGRRAGATSWRGSPGSRSRSSSRSASSSHMDFMIYMDPAAAGEPHASGAYYWLGIDGTWFGIDPALDLAFVGMIQHRGEAQREVHGLSRNWVYQAIVN